jgi:hypothetical protein
MVMVSTELDASSTDAAALRSTSVTPTLVINHYPNHNLRSAIYVRFNV